MIAQLNKEYILAKPSKVLPRLLSYFFYEGRPATTKGRWFNPVTFLLLRAASKGKSSPSAESPVFITGTGRSGSTMLGLVLSMHPDVGFLNEPKALWYVANPTDDIIGSYSNGKADYIMNAQHASKAISNSVKSMYTSFLNRSGSSRIVDKFPEMIFRIEFLNELFADAKYIFLYRNPWETIASTARWSQKNDSAGKKENWWGVNDRKWKLLLEQVVPYDASLSQHTDLIASINSQTDKAAVEWLVTMNYGLKMMEKFPGQILPVKYEDLCLQPEKILKTICAFAALKEDEQFFRFGKQVIQNVPFKSIPPVHPVLHDAILKLSEKLGYGIQSPSMSVTE
jgi:Sulfotransferase family